MHPQTLYPKTKQVLKKLAHLPFLKDFYLAGGTGLALHLGHRKSIDLDVFSDNFPKRDVLLQNLAGLKPKVIQEAPGTLDLTIQGVKVSFLEYNYKLLEPTSTFEKVALASVIDIACMKLTAVSSRGSKKDFVDIYFILDKHPLEELLRMCQKKFSKVSYQELHIIKSLTYFDDADNDPDPDFLENISWATVKETITSKAQVYLAKNF